MRHHGRKVSIWYKSKNAFLSGIGDSLGRDYWFFSRSRFLQKRKNGAMPTVMNPRQGITTTITPRLMVDGSTVTER